MSKNISNRIILSIYGIFVFMLCLNSSALSASKQNKSKNGTPSLSKSNPQGTKPQLIKATWKELHIALLSVGGDIYNNYHIRAGDTILFTPYINSGDVYNIKLTVKNVYANINDPDNGAAEIVVTENGLTRFEGLIYQKYPIINPISSTEYGRKYTSPERFALIDIHPNVRLTPRPNTLMEKNDNRLYLSRNGETHVQNNDAGDVWSVIGRQISSLDIEGSNRNIYYAISSSIAQKSMDGGRNWIQITNGLSGNKTLKEIKINPNNSQEVFILTSGGLYSTIDAGFNWAQTSLRDDIMQLIFHPQDKNVLYARTAIGLYISKNAGITWDRIDNNFPKKLVKAKGNKTTEMPIAAATIALVRAGQPYLLAITETRSILKSDDNGATWKDMNAGFNMENGIYSLYTGDNGTYIGAYDSIYQLKNNSDTWTKIDLLEAGEQKVAGLNGIFPLGGDKGFVVTDRLGKIMFIDNNRRVTGLNYGVMPHSEILDLNSSIINDKQRLFASVINGGMADLIMYGIYYSDNNGITWNKSFTWSMEKEGYWFYINPSNSLEMLLIGSENVNYYNKIFLSSDGGKSWRSGEDEKESGYSIISRSESAIRIHDDHLDKNSRYISNGNLNKLDKRTGNVTTLKVSANEVAIALDDNKKLLTNYLQLSIDGGWTWKSLRSDNKTYAIPVLFTSKEIVSFIYKCESGWAYVHSCTKEAKNGEFMLSNDLGNTWQSLNKFNKLKNIYVSAREPRDIYVVYEKESGRSKGPLVQVVDKVIAINRSSDKGKTWTPFAQYSKRIRSDADLRVKYAELQEGNGKAIYLGTADGLYKTIDDGLTWELLGGIKGNVQSATTLRLSRPTAETETVEIREESPSEKKKTKKSKKIR